MEEKIDIVYLWVDGSDEAWIEQKKQAMKESDKIVDSQPVAEARFVDNEELKYSLRSVEKNAPWINKVYIITADQRPKWLNADHPKVELVSHRDIIESGFLPTFNSHAIEMAIPRIKGLSERFLLANDDMFIAKPIEPEFFYNAKGWPIVRFARHISREKNLYHAVIGKAREAIARRYGKFYAHNPHHNIDAYLKSDVEACNAEFGDWAERTRSQQFRTTDDLQRVIWLYWALAHGRAQGKILRHYDAAGSLKERIQCLLKCKYRVDSRIFGIHGDEVERKFRKYDPTLFCLNDNEKASNHDRECMKNFLERMYPQKSSFEL